MSEAAKRPLIDTGIGRRIGGVVALACAMLAVALIPNYGRAATVTETFDGFSCTGPWVLDPTGPNSSYIRDCGNGWTAYAVDTYSPTSDPTIAGPIGNQNVVTVDTTANGPSATGGSALASGLVNTAPGQPPKGVLWLLKSYPVVPGANLQTIQADVRLKVDNTYRMRYGIVAFDGIVTKPYPVMDAFGIPLQNNVLAGQTDSDGNNTLSGDACFGVTSGQWCAWQTISIGGQYIIPKSSYVTIGFELQDTRDVEQVFGEIDNLTLSGVITTGDPTLPVNDLGQRWGVNYQAPGTDNSAEGAAVAVDSSDGSTVAVGRAYTQHLAGDGVTPTNQDYDIVTTKYDGSGNVVWSKNYDGGSGDQAVAVAVNHDGPGGTQSVYVLGKSFHLRVPGNLADSTNNNDYVVIKYDSSGGLVWSTDITDSARDDVPTGLAVDASGVYVTGSSCASSTVCDYATTMLDPATGFGLWSTALTYYGSSTGSVNDLNKAVGVKVDTFGNVYVTGTTTGSAEDIATVKYNSSGVQQWAKVFDSGGWDDRATALAVDSVGDSFVVGLTYATGAPTIVALKYDTNGNLLWEQKYSSGIETLPSAMTIDGSGDVYVTGKTGRVFDHDIVTVKFNGATGAVLWGKTYGNAGLDDYGADIGVGADGYVYVAGTLTRGSGNTDIVLVKYDKSTGNGVSSITYDGFTLVDTAAALAVGVDAQGDAVPVVVGKTYETTALSDMTTIRFEHVRPDLTVSDLTAPATGTVDGTISVSDTVLNIDDLAAKSHKDSGAFVVGYYLASAVSGSPDLNNLISLNKTRSISNLAPGESSSATTVITIPASVAEGNYYVVVKADDGNAVNESDETNNIVAAATTTAISASMPDLAITSISCSACAGGMTKGAPYDVQVTINNLTSVAVTGSFRVGVYLSSDSTITTADTLLQDTLTIGSLAGNSTYSATITVTIPTDGSVPSTTYYLGAMVDDQFAVAETNEDNNTAVIGGVSNSTLLTTDTDFIPGLSDALTNHVGVAGKGNPGRVILGQSSVAWTAQTAWNVPYASLNVTPELFDLNGDGLRDLLEGSSGGTVYGFENTGTATNPVWTAMAGWNVAPPSFGSCPGMANSSTDTKNARPVIGDFNNDGIPDIMLIGFRYGICAYQNTGGSSGPVWTRQPSWDVPSTATVSLANKNNSPALGDLDGDGKLDLIVGQSLGSTFYAYKNTGTATSPVWTYTPAWNYVPAVANTFPTVKLVDLDRDGKLDMMIGNGNGTVLGVRNTGTTTAPAWTDNSAWNTPDVGSFSAPALGDVNGDGKIDLLIGESGGVSFAYQNTGPYYANSTTNPDGTYVSKVIDSGVHGDFTTLSYIVQKPTNTNLFVDIRSGDTPVPDSSWSNGGAWAQGISSGGSVTTALGTGKSSRYVQYRVRMFSTDSTVTPTLYSIQVYADPAPATPIPVSIEVGGGGGGGGLGLGELLGLGLAGLFGGARRLRRGAC